MNITLDLILEHISINCNAKGIYIFHDLGIYNEMIHDENNYYQRNNGCSYLIPGVLQVYKMKDAKIYLKKMIGD